MKEDQIGRILRVGSVAVQELLVETVLGTEGPRLCVFRDTRGEYSHDGLSGPCGDWGPVSPKADRLDQCQREIA